MSQVSKFSPDFSEHSTAQVTLAPGETNNTLDAGFYISVSTGDLIPATLGNFVWLDTNANGIQDSGEVGVPGAIVTLYSSSGVQVGASQTTGTDGLYLFTDLIPGDYYVQVTPPSGYFFSPQDADGDDVIDSDANTSTGAMAITNLLPSGVKPGWNYSCNVSICDSLRSSGVREPAVKPQVIGTKTPELRREVDFPVRLPGWDGMTATHQ